MLEVILNSVLWRRLVCLYIEQNERKYLRFSCQPWDISWSDRTGTDCGGAGRRDSCDCRGTCTLSFDAPISWRSSCTPHMWTVRSASPNSCRRTRRTLCSSMPEVGSWRHRRTSCCVGVDDCQRRCYCCCCCCRWCRKRVKWSVGRRASSTSTILRCLPRPQCKPAVMTTAAEWRQKPSVRRWCSTVFSFRSVYYSTWSLAPSCYANALR